MKIQKSFAQDVGTLYLVPTPIGNLKDMTFRAVKTLQTVELIASEDTRNTQKLLNHFEIKVPQKSLHEHNYNERIPELVAFLKNGNSIAQVSDAGMPSISDPGHEFVVACIEEDIPVVALPGATAGMTALIASGLLPQPFYFYGFLQRKKNSQKKELTDLKNQTATMIFYESPHRVKETLKNILEIFGNREVVVCRELTKVYEEYLRGTAEELIMYVTEHPLKGECCLLVSGAEEVEKEEVFEGTLKEQVETLILAGQSSKEAIKSIAKRHGLKKQEVYKEYHEL
ncbi:16S rRNA (cytidine(1402)-2'-O)-methyltransferase [Enterococcus dongliensis]|uniref:Ribosomal RNA small subunit methyltransferase I n=1 Tax=Enterococcus dongliensis TaxID=2559925 RepID=A0AAW8TIM2_9ENTE|nr:16S rRNA (cytidine(1402)-2'-O)-methyltransferase [Enterococcus dongliensis]MDT2635965.1 16S rRNA (cytidine(1402)-2'-O)-methyltransferase [Enterococcus dongliensis]